MSFSLSHIRNHRFLLFYHAWFCDPLIREKRNYIFFLYNIVQYVRFCVTSFKNKCVAPYHRSG